LHERGFSSDEAAQAFHTEVTEIFEKGSWKVRKGTMSGESLTAYKGKQELYLHPMIFSGVILQSEVPSIEAMLSVAKTFQLREIGRFEEYEDMSDADYETYLVSKEADIVRDLLAAYRTARKNLYFTGDFSMRVAMRYKINRLASKGKYGDLAWLYAFHLKTALVDLGYIVTAQTRHGIGYRTANKTEQKHLRPLFDENGGLETWWLDEVRSDKDDMRAELLSCHELTAGKR
jgi:hypothetical protein